MPAMNCITTINRSTWATDDFDTFDQAYIKRKCRIGWSAGENILVDRHAIDQYLQTRAVVTGLRYAANTGKTVGVVIGDIDALQGTQCIPQRAPAILTVGARLILTTCAR